MTRNRLKPDIARIYGDVQVIVPTADFALGVCCKPSKSKQYLVFDPAGARALVRARQDGELELTTSTQLMECLRGQVQEG